MNRVMAFGTFDYFHAGHQFYLSQAAKLGDELYVIIARDETVKKVKGFYPDNKEKTRTKTVGNFKSVTKAILGNNKDKYEVLKKYKPDTLCLGYDQFAFTQQLQKKIIDLGLNCSIIRLESYKPEVYKSSLIKKQNATKSY